MVIKSNMALCYSVQMFILTENENIHCRSEVLWCVELELIVGSCEEASFRSEDLGSLF